jgi:hypothetical protein
MRYSPLKTKADSVCAVGINIAVEKITSALVSYQSTLNTLGKETRSFEFWSPRRCDVYVVSFHPGYLQERLEVVAYLWQHNISADLMYESALPGGEHEDYYIDTCMREGILFTVHPRPRFSRREQAAFKVQSILKGTEYERKSKMEVSLLRAHRDSVEQCPSKSLLAGSSIRLQSRSVLICRRRQFLPKAQRATQTQRRWLMYSLYYRAIRRSNGSM